MLLEDARDTKNFVCIISGNICYGKLKRGPYLYEIRDLISIFYNQATADWTKDICIIFLIMKNPRHTIDTKINTVLPLFTDRGPSPARPIESGLF